MQYHQFAQGSAEWHAHRAQFFNASDAPAMLGISPYKTRDGLLRERATGIVPEVSPQQQRVFDRGHELEARARPIAEDIVGEELYPVVGSEGNLAASFDGLTLLGDTAFEHKTMNRALRYKWEVDNGLHLPEHYRAQMEQQLLVSGAERVLFMASEQNADGQFEYQYCWYVSDDAMRQRIIEGWKQFERDLHKFEDAPAPAPAVVARPVESLPVPVLKVGGSLSVSGNLPAFADALRSFILRIPSAPSTDQEFADAEAACKVLKKAEEALSAAQESALAQMGEVEAMRRMVTDLQNLARTTRLVTEKLVKAEKEARKTALVVRARHGFELHVQELERGLKGVRLSVPVPDFGGAIKGLSSLDSMRQKLDAALLEGKAQATSQAERIDRNLHILEGAGYGFLFADRDHLVCTYTARELERIVAGRIAEHQRADADRLEAERERIRKEEEARAVEAAQVQAAAPALPDAAPPALVHEQSGGEMLRLGEINDRLAPLSITTDGMRQLGFHPAAKERSSVLYPAHQWPAICAAIVAHVQACARG